MMSEFQKRLIEIQEEAKKLNKRKKADRLRNQELVKEWYAIKREWRAKN